MPTLEIEQQVIHESGCTAIAGLDEAGRGAIAGPVVAAAVILPLNQPDLLARLAEVDDSKRLTAVTREPLFDLIRSTALAYGIGTCAAVTVDRIGIIPATKQAMQAALLQLNPQAKFLLIDGRIRLKNDPTPQKSIIRGDGKSLSIAAASILAKVFRDRIMIALDAFYPQYGFGRHKGYGVEAHLNILSKIGPCPVHRYTFAPIRQRLI